MPFGHGGAVYTLARRYGLEVQQINDYSSNVSPLLPPKGFYSFIKRHLKQIEILPEEDNFSLRQALGSFFDLDPDIFFPSSGTTEWIFALPRLLCPSKGLILAPTYTDYACALKRAGAQVLFFIARPEENFEFDLVQVEKEICRQRPQMVFICNPNNPTGTFIGRDQLVGLLNLFPEIIFLVDESYIEFLDEKASLLYQRPFPRNLIVLRSFSKIYRVPGLRLGYAIAAPQLVTVLKKACLPWNMNRLAQMAGPWLLSQADYLKRVQGLVVREKKYWLPRLSSLPGVKVFSGRVHFFLLALDKPAQGLWELLLRRYHILVRLAHNFLGLGPNYLRIALKTREENRYLIKALEEILK